MNTKPLIELPTIIGKEYLNPEDIITIKANDKSISVSTENQDEKEVKLPFGRAEKLFDHPWFVKCHRSHIINIKKIKEYICKQNKIKLTNNILVPLSDRYKEKFEQVIKTFCKK